MTQFLCDMCFPEHEEIGQIHSGLTVVVDKENTYYLCWGSDGHSQSLYKMQVKPWPDPFQLLTEEEQDAEEAPKDFDEAFDLWIDNVSIDEKLFFNWLGDILQCYWFMRDLIENGYSQDKDGYPWYYVFHQAGLIVNQHET